MKQMLFIMVGLLMVFAACSAQKPAMEEVQTMQEETVSQAVVSETMSSSYDVQIKNFEFLPKVLTIKAGDSVTWTNLDDVAHTATGADFDTGKLGKGESKTITFDTPGTHPYICSPHPRMQGEIVVE